MLVNLLKPTMLRLRAAFRRELSRSRTKRALQQLDDRMLSDIGMTRAQIPEIARETSCVVAPMTSTPLVGFRMLLARVKCWRQRRLAILQLSSLDDRLLQDIGIEPGRVDELVDAVLDQRHRLEWSDPLVQLSRSLMKSFGPLGPSSHTSTIRSTRTRRPEMVEGVLETKAAWIVDKHDLATRAANDSQPVEWQPFASAGDAAVRPSA